MPLIGYCGGWLAMDDEIDGALLANAEAAAARWKNRTRIREARTDALIRHEILAADSPDRLAARLNNIISDVRKSGGECSRRKAPS